MLYTIYAARAQNYTLGFHENNIYYIDIKKDIKNCVIVLDTVLYIYTCLCN